MKYLAILRDSLREAIDAKVFTIMLVISALLVLLAMTITVTPTGRAEDFMAAATTVASKPPAVDDLSLHKPGQILRQLVERLTPDRYTLVRVEPIDGPADHPRTRYRVVVHGRGRDNPAATLDQLRERFGNVLGTPLVAVADARVIGPAGDGFDFELTTEPTAATVRLWPSRLSLLFGLVPLGFLDQAPLGAQLYLIENILVNGFGAWVAILVSIILTAFFIPNMLRKGSLDLLLSKPISRPALLLYKYVGGLTFIFLNTAFIVVGIWLMLGLRTGVWAPGFLMSIPVITFFFAILYAASALFGVLTHSPIASILLTCLVWFVLWLVGLLFQLAETQATNEGRRAMHEAWQSGKPKAAREPYVDDGKTPEQRRAEENWFFKGARGLHAVLPRTSDLDLLMSRALLADLLFGNRALAEKLDSTPVNWGETLGVSLAFIAVMLGLACWRFSAGDH